MKGLPYTLHIGSTEMVTIVIATIHLVTHVPNIHVVILMETMNVVLITPDAVTAQLVITIAIISIAQQCQHNRHHYCYDRQVELIQQINTRYELLQLMTIPSKHEKLST